MQHLVVIGCGSSGIYGLTELAHLLERDHGLGSALSYITIIKPSSGDSNSFGKLDEALITNTTNAAIDQLDPDWKTFREIREKTDEEYSSRSLFGEYLEFKFENSVKRLKKLVDVVVCTESVLNISKQGPQKYNVTTETNFFCADYIFLCIGNSRIRNTKFSPNIISAYDLDKYPKDKTASIGVIGTGLRAVDVLILLDKIKHKGPIYVSSRTGKLPRVQPHKEVMNEFAGLLPALNPTRDLGAAPYKSEAAIGFLLDKFLSVGIEITDLQNLIDTTPTAERTWAEEIDNSDKFSRRWYCRAFQLTALMEECWQLMPETDREHFNRHYRHKWMPNLIGIPKRNAKVIESLFDKKLLKVIPEYKGVFSDGEISEIYSENEKIQVDYLIDATPFGLNSGIQNPLITILNSNNLVEVTLQGNIKNNWDTMEAINKGIPTNIFCAGEFAMGPNPVPNSIETNLRMAKAAIFGFARKLENESRYYEIENVL